MINVIKVLHDTTVDGPGFRTSIYCAGCRHRCPGCHNQQTWAFGSGTDRSTDDLLQEILADPFADVTFSGGDPMQQAEGFAALAEAVKTRTNKTIWCYTGYTYEALLRMPAQRRLLANVDVLVDGPFLPSQKSADLLFRGSANQRIIDVPRSLATGQTVLWQR